MRIEEWLQGVLLDLREAYPPADWPNVGTEAYDEFFERFRKAFARNGVSEAESREAIDVMAEDPPRFKAEAVQKTVDAVKAIRETSPATDGLTGAPISAVVVPPRGAVEASKDCPECRGTGWAQRRAKWHSIERPFLLNMTCRCPLGLWRSAHDEEGEFDSLQANPDIWDAELSHRTWTDRVIDSPCRTAVGSEGKWHYLKPGDLAPPTIASVREMAIQTARDMAPPSATPHRRRPDLGKVEPAVPIPPKPAPEPATVETVDDILEWL
jgi:hypothetical protein